MKNLILASTSTVHGSGPLEYLLETLESHFRDASDILFIPFARPGGVTHESYTEKVRLAFQPIGKNVQGLHEFDDKIEAIKKAEAIFTGGGNTFVLLKQLYDLNLMNVLKTTLESDTPYLGTSAGTNICGMSIGTTNDMPIVYPKSFKALELIPFNINPHYLDPDPKSTHMGETRETRIGEFHKFNDIAVCGLREGSYLKVNGNAIILEGTHSARIFQKDQPPHEIYPGTGLGFIN